MNFNQTNWSEQDIMTDLLTQEKHLVETYSTNITESSCTNLRDVLTRNQQTVAGDQYQMFDHMKQKGFYEVKDAQDADVTNAKTKMSNMRNTLM